MIAVIISILFVLYFLLARIDPGVPRDQHPAPWWYRLLARIAPGRCREIPEANNPTWSGHDYGDAPICRRCGDYGPDHTSADDPGCPRIVLRQFAIIKRYVYLQQFACAEDPRFMHSHPYRFMIAIGLWGGYFEQRIAGAARWRIAPYLYTLDGGHVHHVQQPLAGHTSIFVGLFRAADGTDGDKHYYGTPERIRVPDVIAENELVQAPSTLRKLWTDHIRKQVKRI